MPGRCHISSITSKNEEVRFIFTVQTGNAKFLYRRNQKFKKIFFQLRVKVQVNECTTASAAILLHVVGLLVQMVKSEISFPKEELVFHENTGDGTLGVTG